jgi:hypothetical protein
MFNPRLASKLSEAYSNGEVSRSFGGSYLNTYPNTTFNNFGGDENWITNNIGSGVIDTYNGNPEGQQQQMRFNEIASQVLQEQQSMNPIQNPNQSLLDFANNLSHQSNNPTTYLPYMRSQYNQNDQASIIPTASPNRTQLNDQTIKQEMNKQYDYVPYSMERKFNSGELAGGLNKNTAMLIGIICIIGFMMFMLIQLYMSQKRVEYIVSLYRDIPTNSPYFVADRFRNLTYDHE